MEKVFFQLLHSGLFGTPVDVKLLPETIQWDEILQIAKDQTVLPTVADAIWRLPDLKRPPKTVLERLQRAVFGNMSNHQALNKAVAESVKCMSDHGIPTVLLKGQGIAKNYRIAELRQCGDIDLYVGPDNYDKASKIAMEELWDKGTEYSETQKHLEIEHNGISIEVHRVAAMLHAPWNKRAFAKWIKESLEQSTDHDETDFGGVTVKLPPLDFNVFFIFFHIWHHFITGGIGLRQLCDLTMLLHTRKGDIDTQKLEAKLREFGLMKQWQIIAHIIVNKIGLPEEEMPFYTADVEGKSKRVYDYIITGGNFGHKASRKKVLRKVNRPWIVKKSYALIDLVNQISMKFSYDPVNAVFTNGYFIKAGFKKVFNMK